MKTWFRWVILTVAMAALFHFLTVTLFPRVIMALAFQRILDRSDSEINTMVHSPRVTVDSRQVVKPSPDLLYSICVYDVSEKPLRITATVPDTYWSISFYQANTDNFYVLNDRQANSNPIDIILVGPDMAVPRAENTRVVVAPTNKGVFPLRSLIENEDKLGDLINTQRLAICRPF
ncbi:MAG: DUF1254 domain-containing protein [bacterium]|nr:DUF1254 domain-containing protein [bacterium]